jgi:CheY-like chemotaxis protein
MVPVIVVEDEPLVGESLVRSFCRLGWTGLLITDPMELEAVMAVEQPLLLVSDLRMPGRSGIEVLSFAREHHPHVKRCLLSGSLGELRPDDLDRIRPCFLLGKPWGTESLRQLMVESAPG